MVTCSNILKNFSSQDPVLLVGRIALCVALLCSLPMLALPCRSAMLKLCAQIVDLVRGTNGGESGEHQPLLSQRAGEAGFLTGRQRSRRGTDWLSAASRTTASIRSASPCPSAFSDGGDDDDDDDEKDEDGCVDIYGENGGLLDGSDGDKGEGVIDLQTETSSLVEAEPPSFMTRAGQTLAVLLPALSLGLLIPNVLTVWTIMGSAAGSLVAFVVSRVILERAHSMKQSFTDPISPHPPSPPPPFPHTHPSQLQLPCAFYLSIRQHKWLRKERRMSVGFDHRNGGGNHRRSRSPHPWFCCGLNPRLVAASVLLLAATIFAIVSTYETIIRLGEKVCD